MNGAAARHEVGVRIASPGGRHPIARRDELRGVGKVGKGILIKHHQMDGIAIPIAKANKGHRAFVPIHDPAAHAWQSVEPGRQGEIEGRVGVFQG